MKFELLKTVSFALIFSICQLSAALSPTEGSLPVQELTPTQTILSVSPSEKSFYSEQVRFVAKVVPTYVPGLPPSGTVEFFIDKKSVARQPLVNNIAVFTIDAMPASPYSSHRIAVGYSGDQTYAASRDLLDYVVLPVKTAVNISSSMNPSTWGETVLFTVNVQSLRPGRAIPQGSIQFKIEGNVVQTLPLDEKGSASFSTADIEVGERLVTVSFLGNENFNKSYSSLTQQVDKTETTITLASSENPAIFGKAPVIAAKVASPFKERMPSGEIQFQVDGADVGDRAALNAKGEAQFTVSGLASGDHRITALYLGDLHFYPSKDLLTQRIDKAATKSVLVSSKNPAIYHAKLTVAASVSSDYAIPFGLVKLMIDGVTVSNQNLDSSGNAIFTVPRMDAGKHTLTAVYPENPNFKESSAKVSQEIDKADTSATLASSGNPSLYGSPLAFTANVTSGESKPKGSVQFLLDGVAIETRKLDTSGRASIEIPLLDAGDRKITASFLGNANYNPSAASFVQEVKKADTEISMISSENPSLYGSVVSLTAVASSPGAKPKGSIQFLVDGKSFETKRTDAIGRATLVIPRFDAGEHVVMANFLENMNFNPSSGSIIQEVTKADTWISLNSSENPAVYGSDIVFTASVASRAGKPQGPIAFKSDGKVSLTDNLDANGQASFKVSNLSPGTHDISVTYLGDSNFSESSATVQQTIEERQQELQPEESKQEAK